MSDRKINFCSKYLSLQLFRATVANADMQNRMVQTTGNVELFDKKRVFYNHFWQIVAAILEDVSVAKIIV